MILLCGLCSTNSTQPTHCYNIDLTNDSVGRPCGHSVQHHIICSYQFDCWCLESRTDHDLLEESFKLRKYSRSCKIICSLIFGWDNWFYSIGVIYMINLWCVWQQARMDNGIYRFSRKCHILSQWADIKFYTTNLRTVSDVITPLDTNSCRHCRQMPKERFV